MPMTSESSMANERSIAALTCPQPAHREPLRPSANLLDSEAGACVLLHRYVYSCTAHYSRCSFQHNAASAPMSVPLRAERATISEGAELAAYYFSRLLGAEPQYRLQRKTRGKTPCGYIDATPFNTVPAVHPRVTQLGNQR
jgi:hypothetical protein